MAAHSVSGKIHWYRVDSPEIRLLPNGKGLGLLADGTITTVATVENGKIKAIKSDIVAFAPFSSLNADDVLDYLFE